ncbi:TRAP transporter large permease [Falsiroseomonas oryzae]|uniref:TRAP transporter large permease n=1 Tax=Falsiroseomonas oryzae TaxID=2766473 RepID=UPI0022EADF1E|nr:TRAP transporter large permease [Roseomonas sp. MO-31]
MTGALVAFAAFVAVGVPIAFALGAAAAIGLWMMDGVPLDIVASRTFGAIDSFTFLAIPFFILAGELMETGGISRRLIALATALVGHIRGGLANVTVVAMMLFSGVSGSTNADAAAVGSVMIPSMRQKGWDPARAGAVVAAAAGMGILVPPCLTMVVYGSVTNTSIAALFAAGLLPAAVMAGALLLHIRLEGAGPPPEPRVAGRERLRLLRGAALALGLPLIIFGGILGGAFTPTEAAVVAVAYAVLAGLLHRELTWAFFWGALVRSGVSTGAVMLMIAGANILAWLLTVEQVPQTLASLIQSVGGGRIAFLLFSIVVFLVLFALLDGLPGMLMLIPVFVPIARELGIDTLHYGLIMTTVMGIALFLPPLGVGLYIVLGISGGTLPAISRALAPYLLTMSAVAVLVALWPGLVLVLPRLMGLHGG